MTNRKRNRSVLAREEKEASAAEEPVARVAAQVRASGAAASERYATLAKEFAGVLTQVKAKARAMTEYMENYTKEIEELGGTMLATLISAAEASKAEGDAQAK